MRPRVTTKAGLFTTLEPGWLWAEFDALRAIPRPSGHEARAREHVKSRFADAAATLDEDAAGNLLVRVPGTRGLESAPGVTIQSHLDMVIAVEAGVEFDPEHDGIECRIEGDYLYANDTTLGADNGIGVAAAIATALDPAVEHGPLELLFTIEEETGLTGARELDPRLVKSRRLLNLDSEEDDILYVGCAGGRTTTLALPVEWQPAPAGAAIAIEVTGLHGGHSGTDIHLNRANAHKLLVRVLAAGGSAGALAEVAGGGATNAIPTASRAVVVAAAQDAAHWREIAAAQAARACDEFPGDPGLVIQVSDVAKPDRVMTEESSRRVVDLLAALPSGVLAMSRAGGTETSCNLARVTIAERTVDIVVSVRSSVGSALRGALDTIEAAARLAGAVASESEGYPEWQPNFDGPLVHALSEVYARCFGAQPKVATIHAGLETALIGRRVPGLQMISYGPLIEFPHSAHERVNIPSVAKFWKFHCEVLKALARA